VLKPETRWDPVALRAKLDAGADWFGTIDAIGHRAVPVPGTEQAVDYRSGKQRVPTPTPLEASRGMVAA
jgi:hypothetical protein